MRVGLVVLLLLPAYIAHADELRLVVEREAGAEACPDAAELDRRVSETLGRQAFVDGARERLVVRVTPRDGRLRAEILRVGEWGADSQRQLESGDPRCVELGEALVLALAVAVDPSYFDAPLARRVEPAPEPPTPRASPRHVEPPPPPRPNAPWRGVELSLAGLAAAGEAPEPGLGTALHAAWVTPRHSFGLELGARTRGEEDVAAGRVEVRPWRVAFLPCLRLGAASACGLAALNLLEARGRELVDEREDRTWILALGGKIAWDFAISRRLIVRPYAEGGGSLVRARVRVAGEPVWDSPLGVIAAGIAVVWRID
jgi:hypothetical protein